jgi:pimeloyl-ACP methyl ester carboxylesterase
VSSAFVLVHGSWHDGAVWHRVAARLRHQGRRTYAPTLTGMDASAPPAGSDVGLETHIADVVNLLEREDLHDAILVGHSYAGFVIAAAADRARGRLAALVYLDAFIPADGESLYDLNPGLEERLALSLTDERGRTRGRGAAKVWLLPPGDPAGFGVDDPEDQRWLRDGHMPPTPELTFREPVRLNGNHLAIPAVFARCTRFGLAGPEARARQHGYTIHRIDAGHDAMLTHPDQVAALLLSI